MIPLTAFAVRRPTWLRGEGGIDSRLLRVSDGRQCCLGQYLTACGVPHDALAEVSSPGEVAGPDVPAWLLNPDGRDSVLAEVLMEVNDDHELSEVARESTLTARFAQAGITVRFVGRRPRRP